MSNKPSKRRRGIVLITTLFFMVLFYMLAFGIYTQSQRGSSNGESRNSLRDKTVTEASFACGAGIRMTKEWVSAVTKPGTSGVDQLGFNWTGPPKVIGSRSFVKTHHDVFSVPDDDPNFNMRPLAGLACPHGRFAGKTGIDFLGFRPDTNLTGVDYTGMKAQEANWPVFVNPTPMTVGEYQVYNYLVPSAKAVSSALGESGETLKSFLVVSIAYRDNLPVLRARVLLKEISSSKYAYRSNQNGNNGGEPITWTVSNADSVIFDGPAHTNDVWVTSFAGSYWDAALTYFPWDTAKEFPKRAFMGGGLTFSGSNTSITPNFDGVAYKGGNFGGSSDARRPHDGAGVAFASTAQGTNPDPKSGRIVTRYDRMIEGGREAIRKIPAVPLPADLNNLKAGAFGTDTVTGLNTSDPNPMNWQVDANQKNFSVQNTTVTRPGYFTSTGKWVPPVTRNNAAGADVGIFVNPASGTWTAAGGVAIKGDTRNMYLEVTDANGRLVTSGLHSTTGADPESSNTTVGNPTIRIQSTIDSYDVNSGTNITAYTQTGTTGGKWQDTVPGTYVPTVPAKFMPTVPGKYVPTVAGKFVPTVPGKFIPTVPGTYVPTVPGKWNEPTGTGSGSGYWDPVTQNAKWSPATQNAKWDPATQNAKWDPPTQNAKWDPPTQNAYTAPTQPAKWDPATIPAGTVGGGTPVYGASGTVLDPFVYKPQDWVVDVKNVDMQIQPTMPLPTGVDSATWRAGYGARLPAGEAHTLQANLLGDTPGPASQKGITEVYVHTQSDPNPATKISGPVSVPKGKIAVFKQSRSDANRLDVFILDNPNPPPPPGKPWKAGLSGAVYGTGNISGLRGVNMEAKTIGVDYSTNKGISFMDNVTQYGTVPGERTPNGFHGLGIVGTKLNVQTRENWYDNATNRFYIYATMIAGKSAAGDTGGLDVSRSPNNANTADFNRTANSTNTNGANRTLFIYGGVTEQETKARLVGSSGGSMGFNQQFNFDKHLSFLPPPFFPTTNQLAPLAYFQEVVLGQ